MAYRVLGAPLYNIASMGNPFNGYIFVFYFPFCFGEIFKYILPIKEFPGLF